MNLQELKEQYVQNVIDDMDWKDAFITLNELLLATYKDECEDGMLDHIENGGYEHLLEDYESEVVLEKDI